jgi:hypothetical protein
MKTLFLILLAPLMLIFRGFTIQTMWMWFIVPLKMPEISIFHSIGISMLISFIIYTRNPEREERTSGEIIGTNIILCCIVLIFGYI